MRAIATSSCKFHNHDIVVCEFHEIDVATILLEVGTHLLEDVFDFSEDGFFIHTKCIYCVGRDAINRVSTRFMH